jgi:hypothetical protein
MASRQFLAETRATALPVLLSTLPRCSACYCVFCLSNSLTQMIEIMMNGQNECCFYQEHGKQFCFIMFMKKRFSFVQLPTEGLLTLRRSKIQNELWLSESGVPTRKSKDRLRCSLCILQRSRRGLGLDTLDVVE